MVQSQAEELKNARKLTDDEIDRLSLNVPQCISVLAHAKEVGAGKATFNDVAVQLTAYALTSGTTENDFVNKSFDFIAHYPSTSLTTIEKRLENVRARYRNMAANNYTHSCGGVKALGFAGFDCSTCTVMPGGGEYLTVDVMTKDDINKTSSSLVIPDHILRPGGLITKGVDALCAPGQPMIPQYILPVVLSHIARAISGKLACNGVWPNLYNVKIGPTSTGKSASDKALLMSDLSLVKGFHGPSSVASGPAIMSHMSEHSSTLLVMDEVTSLLKRNGKNDSLADGKREVLLEVHAKAGISFQKYFADSKKALTVNRPCLNITGNATPIVFNELQQDDFDSGLIQRFDFWFYDGPILPRGISGSDNKTMDEFVNSLIAIHSAKIEDPNCGLSEQMPFPIQMTPACAARLAELSAHVIDRANSGYYSESIRGIIGRQYELCIRYGLIHMAAMRNILHLTDPMDLADLNYGWEVASMLAEWKIDTLQGKVVTGDFHKDCEYFKSAIISAIKIDKRPTFKILANRKPGLKDWHRARSNEVIEVLKKRGEIVLDDSKKTTAYFLPKD